MSTGRMHKSFSHIVSMFLKYISPKLTSASMVSIYLLLVFSIPFFIAAFFPDSPLFNWMIWWGMFFNKCLMIFSPSSSEWSLTNKMSLGFSGDLAMLLSKLTILSSSFLNGIITVTSERDIFFLNALFFSFLSFEYYNYCNG